MLLRAKYFLPTGVRLIPVPLDVRPTYTAPRSEGKRFIVFLDSGAVPARYPCIITPARSLLRDRQRQAQRNVTLYRQTQTPGENCT
jgi:hypothetical protein